jgi:tryptophan synthase alpha chain
MNNNRKGPTINQQVSRISKKNQSALSCYVLTGYRDIKTTKEIISTVVYAGVDIIEMRISFSDSITDRPIIQEVSYNALVKGITLQKV